eukprot:CAMPEP_0117652350 /NCGR_PEP_ID=MMETSP0804-20121206/2579_1 /TAXON_ID=1074897 /ORGANISM="Tetraselmis astigmatica, Strain CCMP880" /LENGTH=607 /DNA_ID=CAMNT_0005458389 /DNA_START=187 /DNA_END=2010 /DNA_ORIENTATION=+
MKREADEWGRIWEEVHGANTRDEFLARMNRLGLVASRDAGRTSAPNRPTSPSHVLQPQPPGGLPATKRESATEAAPHSRFVSATRGDAPPALTKELAQSVAHENVIIVTWANDHFADFVMNWVHHIKAHGISNYLVGAMDHDIGRKLVAAGIQSFAMYGEDSHTIDGLHTGAFVWGGDHFHKMGRQKIGLAKTFTNFGLDLMLCDVDVVWIKDPTHYISSIPEADILTSSDSLHSTIPTGDRGLELPDAAHSAMNIGLMFFRHSDRTRVLIHAWNDMLEGDAKLWDQEAFNRLIRTDWMPFKLHPHNKRLFSGFRHTLWVGVLPVASFASGHTFFVQQLWQIQNVEPFVVHTTFQYGGPAGKLSRLRESNLWKDSPQYFQGKFIGGNVSAPRVPPNWAAMSNDDRIAFHKQSMARQLGDMQQLFLLAVATNRTLIMPRLLCFCDRYWGPVEDCRVPGAFATRLPFTCPMDHILEPFHMDDDPSKFGTPIRFREYSFLERAPAGHIHSSAQLVFDGTAGPQLGSHVGAGGPQVHLPARFTDLQARSAAHSAGNPDLLWAPDLSSATGSIEAPRERGAFGQRMHHVGGVWCCQGTRGGYSYTPMLTQQR